jgi:CDP-paratose 2-epimerase
MEKKKLLITGGLGFIGVNTATFLNNAGYQIVLIDNFYRKESFNNRQIINSHKEIEVSEMSILDSEGITELIKKNNFYAVLNFAGQVAMTNSIQDPYNDFLINTVGNFNLLESIRKHSPETLFLYTSSNKVYGDLKWDNLEEKLLRYESIKNKYGYNTEIPIELKSPYGCSKGASDFYTIDYKNTFGLNTLVLRLSTIYGQNQFSTYNQGWIGWFIKEFFNKNNLEISGNGKQVRDILHVNDFSNLIYLIIENFSAAKESVYNVGGGYTNSISLLELFEILSLKFNFIPKVTKLNERISDQRYYVSNLNNLERDFSWVPQIGKLNGIDSYSDWIAGN